MATFVVLYSTPGDPERFDRSYREGHLPLLLKTPGLESVDAYPVRRTLRGEPACHLLAVLTFADDDAMRAGMRSPEWAAAGENLATFGGVDIATMFTVGEPETYRP